MDIEVLKEITLLYVEDDNSIRELVTRTLKQRVKTLYVASDGEEAFLAYKENKPDMIVTDIQMPNMTGIELTKKIRESDCDIPIFVTTAYNTVEYLSESISLEITGYLVKPIDYNIFFPKLIKKAKEIIVEKKEAQQTKTLQSIIDADSHMLAVTDLQTLKFANKSFMKFFNFTNCKEFHEKNKEFIDIFMEQDGFLHRNMLEDEENFIELINRTDVSNRNVMVFDFNTFSPASYYISVTKLDQEHLDDVYLVSLVDISQMTLERVKLQNKVYHDNLTGIYNRNKLDEVFEYEMHNAKRYGRKFSMILVDIDHFKKFNDTYGHIIGDEVLVLLAKTISKITRNTDTFARWGGEEFVMVLPETVKENAAIVAENLRKSVEQIHHKVAGGITASFGVCEYELGDTEEIMYKKCDEALYRAKENGRNRVEVS